MLTNHDKDLVCEITDFNTLTLVTAAYTIYENLCTKKPWFCMIVTAGP